MPYANHAAKLAYDRVYWHTKRKGSKVERERVPRKRRQSLAWYYANKARVAASNRAWFRTNGRRYYKQRKSAQRAYYMKNRATKIRNQRRLHRARWYWWNYRLTNEQVDAMRRKQRQRCFICRRKIKLVVDHDHKTGRVRGMLCDWCNHRLGWLEKRKEVILAYVGWQPK